MIETITAFFNSFYNINIAEPVRLQLLAVPLAFFILLFLTWLVWLYRRPALTYGSVYPFFGRFIFWFSLTITMMFLIFAWSRPYVEGSPVIKRGNAEVIFIVDYSSSMFIKDTGIPRIEIVSRELRKLIPLGILQEGDRVALYALGLQPIRYLPLTNDLDNFANEASKIGMPDTLIGSNIYWGSDVGSMLERVYISLDRQDSFPIYKGEEPPANWKPEIKSNRLVIFMGDGDYFNYTSEEKQLEEDDRKYFEVGLNEFRMRNLKIYPIGIGTLSGGSVLDILENYKSGSEYDPKLLEDLRSQISRLNISNLDYIRNSTGADKMFLIENENIEADDFIRSVIDGYRSIIVEPVTTQDREEVWLYFVILAIMIAVVGTIITRFS